MTSAETKALWRGFGTWIRLRREELRLSQGGVAQRAGIDRQTIYRIENGLSGTRRDTVLAIAHALSLDSEESLERAGFSPGIAAVRQKPQNAAEFVERLREMGFEIQTSFEYEHLGPDALQDIIDRIEAELIYKTSRKK